MQHKLEAPKKEKPRTEAWTSRTWPIGSMTSRSPPSAMFRAWAMSSTPHLDPLPILPLRGSIEGEERRPGFYRSAHQRAGPFHACRQPFAQTKARDNPALAPSGANPSIGATSSRTAPSAVGGADGAGTDVCPITTVVEDASAAFSIACPAAGAAAGTEDDLSCSAPICYNVVASGYTASIMGMAFSIYTGGGPICVASTCDVMVVPHHDSTAPGAIVSTYGDTIMTGCATSPMGTLCVPFSICPSVGAAITASRTPPMGAMAVLAPLPLDAALADP
jgi:hypothetical protein